MALAARKKLEVGVGEARKALQRLVARDGKAADAAPLVLDIATVHEASWAGTGWVSWCRLP